MKILCVVIMLFLIGCQSYTPQRIKYCGTFYLYTDKGKLDAEWYNSGGLDVYSNDRRLNGFYRYQDNSIHAMKWDFETIGHELYHGLQRNGLNSDGFIHFNKKD